MGLLVFIMFVQHIASFLQPATIATGVFTDTLRTIRETYPEELPLCVNLRLSHRNLR